MCRILLQNPSFSMHYSPYRRNFKMQWPLCRWQAVSPMMDTLLKRTLMADGRRGGGGRAVMHCRVSQVLVTQWGRKKEKRRAGGAVVGGASLPLYHRFWFPNALPSIIAVSGSVHMRMDGGIRWEGRAALAWWMHVFRAERRPLTGDVYTSVMLYHLGDNTFCARHNWF